MRRKITVVVAMALFAMASCTKDNSNTNTNPTNPNNPSNPNNPNPSTPTYFFKAKIDGTMYTGGHSLASHMLDSSIAIGSTISYKGATVPFVVEIDPYAGPKTYNDPVSMIQVGNTGSDYSDFFIGNSTVKIVADGGAANTVLKGEFSGKLYLLDDSTKSIDVTEGSFEAKWSN